MYALSFIKENITHNICCAVTLLKKSCSRAHAPPPCMPCTHTHINAGVLLPELKAAVLVKPCVKCSAVPNVQSWTSLMTACFMVGSSNVFHLPLVHTCKCEHTKLSGQV